MFFITIRNFKVHTPYIFIDSQHHEDLLIKMTHLLKTNSKQIGLISGPLVSLTVYFFVNSHQGYPLALPCACIAIWMGIWWLTEAVPLAITSLLPLVFFPLLGILKASETAGKYTNDVVFLFIGGFMVALAMERWNLHKRIALYIVILFKGGFKVTLLGFMIATAFLSMWISNTATTMMMVPIALAVIYRYDQLLKGDENLRLAPAFLLGIAYSASIGGLATLVGTPPNLVFAQLYEQSFPDLPAITFAQWMLFALPVSMTMLMLAWLLLSFLFIRKMKIKSEKEMFRKELRGLGAVTFEEKIVFIVFCLMALLWLFRKPLVIGSATIPGWSTLFPQPGFIGDGTVSITMALILFLVPTKGNKTLMLNGGSKTIKRILDVNIFPDLPWGIVLLFGGGFALAAGIVESGLSTIIGDQLKGLASFSPVAITLSICTMMTFVTELTSNTATTQMILPILAAVATAIGQPAFLLMIPAALSASCAFMMPVATPPNAIVFGSGRVKIYQMARTGLILNLVGIIVITFWVLVWADVVFKSTVEAQAIITSEMSRVHTHP